MQMLLRFEIFLSLPEQSSGNETEGVCFIVNIRHSRCITIIFYSFGFVESFFDAKIGSLEMLRGIKNVIGLLEWVSFGEFTLRRK